MKRVIYIFCLVVIILNLPKCNSVSLNEFIIANPGYDYTNYLTKEGECHLGNNIDWSSEGVYWANFYNENDDSIIKRHILLATNESLEKTTKYYFNYFQTSYNKDYYVVKSIFISQTDFIVIGNIYLDNHEQTQFEATHSYIQYYQNNKLKWEYIIDSEINNFRDVVITKYGIVVLGNIVRDNINQNIIIYEFSLDGKLLRQKEFNGEGYDSAQKIFLDGNNLFIVGQSSSRENDYPHRMSNNMMVTFIHLQYSNFESFQIEGHGNNGYNYLVDALIIDDYLYVLVKLGGTGGYFKSDYETYNNYALLGMNKHFDILSYHIFEQIGIYEGLVQCEKEIIVITNSLKDNKGIINFYRFDSHLKIISSLDYPYSQDNFLYDLKLAYDDNTFYILAEINSLATKQVTDFVVLGFNKDCENIYHEKISQDRHVKGILLYQSDIYLYGVSNKQFFLDYCFYVHLNPLSKEIRINNSLLHSRPIPGIEKIDYNVFGTYQQHYCHRLDNFTVINSQELVIKPNINIRPNEIYDIGLILNFNGQAYLNDWPIDVGYTINEKGKYQLEVIGKDERKIINFTIDDLSSNPINSIEEPSPRPTVEIDSSLKTANHEVYYSDLAISKDDSSNSIFFLISISLVSILFAWYLPPKKPKSKVQDEKM